MRTTVPAVPRWRTPPSRTAGATWSQRRSNSWRLLQSWPTTRGWRVSDRLRMSGCVARAAAQPSALTTRLASAAPRRRPHRPRARGRRAGLQRRGVGRGGRQLAGGHGGRAAGSDAGGARGCVHGAPRGWSDRPAGRWVGCHVVGVGWVGAGVVGLWEMRRLPASAPGRLPAHPALPPAFHTVAQRSWCSTAACRATTRASCRWMAAPPTGASRERAVRRRLPAAPAFD